LKSNSLSGPIPESLGRLIQLVFLDLSNNQLTGTFPAWVDRLKSLKLLNLGQNDFSGTIPPYFSLQNINGYQVLSNIPLLIRQLKGPISNGRSLSNRDRLRPVILKLNRFLKGNHAFRKIRQNMLWVDVENVEVLQLEKVVNEYIKAEETHLLTTIFQIMRDRGNGQLPDLFPNGLMLKKIRGS
jgi:hypothetical protein